MTARQWFHLWLIAYAAWTGGLIPKGSKKSPSRSSQSEYS